MPLNDTGADFIVDPATQWSFYDDLFYPVTGQVPFESEGTFGLVAAKGGVIGYASGNVAGNRARLNASVTQLAIDPTKNILILMKAQTLQGVNVSHFFGAFSALPTAANPPVEPNDGIYFRRKDVGAFANWFAVARKGGVETAVDTGIVGDANMHDFRIVHQNGNAQYWIDGALKATIATGNTPVVALFAGLVWATLEAVAKTDNIDAIAVVNSRI